MVGSELRERRRAAGLTQEEVARLLAVAPNTVARWESGNRRITERAARQLRMLLAFVEGNAAWAELLWVR